MTTTEFKGQIVEGAYYEREDGDVVGPARPTREGRWYVGNWGYDSNGVGEYGRLMRGNLTRRVYVTHADPAEVVAELRAEGQRCRSEYVDADSKAIGTGYLDAADLVAEKLVGEK